MSQTLDPRETQIIAELSEFDAARLPTLVAALEQMPIGVIVAEPPSGRISLYNRRAEEILGHAVLPAEQIVDYGSYGGVHQDGTEYAPEDYPTREPCYTAS